MIGQRGTHSVNSDGSWRRPPDVDSLYETAYGDRAVVLAVWRHGAVLDGERCIDAAEFVEAYRLVALGAERAA